MKSRKFWTIGIGLVGILIVFSALMEFGYKGVANSETVRIVKAESASPKRIAMLIERSDSGALSGNTYFVFVGDRIYSLPELRRKLYGLPAVFRVGRRDGLSIAWSAMRSSAGYRTQLLSLLSCMLPITQSFNAVIACAMLHW
jgi:hypothetical protein